MQLGGTKLILPEILPAPSCLPPHCHPLAACLRIYRGRRETHRENGWIGQNDTVWGLLQAEGETERLLL